MLTVRRCASTRAIHNVIPRLSAERRRDVVTLFEASSDKARQFRLTGAAGSVQVLFWANVAELWGRGMRDSVGLLAPLWQRGTVVSLCALVAGAFTLLAVSIPRHTVARLVYWPELEQIQFATFTMFGRERLHDPVPLKHVSLPAEPADSKSKYLSFRAPRAAGRADRFYDLPLKVELRGTFHRPEAEVRRILSSSSSNNNNNKLNRLKGPS